MDKAKDFYDAARSLSRNPLGIIALFIVLVYAVASLVIGLGQPPFWQNPFHPAVLFLAFFPVVVLVVFTHLVARYHTHLYAPGDYKNQEHFFYGIEVPTSVRGTDTGVATSDSQRTITDPAVTSTIKQAYSKFVNFGFVLVHQSEVIRPRTSPRSGRYRVRVWVESIERQRPLSEIESVTYHVWHDSTPPILTTADQKTSFDLWLSIYGEYPVLALVKTRDGQTHELQRFIDLPGRPPD
jgi:hypothetical protein